MPPETTVCYAISVRSCWRRACAAKPPNWMKNSTSKSSTLRLAPGVEPMREKLPDNSEAATRPCGVMSLGQLLQHQPAPTPALIDPAVLPFSGILFVGGEPKVGKSLLVANLALALASGCSRAGFQVPRPQRVLICQFEFPTP